MERSFLTRWLVLAGLVVAAFAGTVATLDLTLYSASGFVSSYLHALARHDVDAALRMPGVDINHDGSKALLTREATADLDDIASVSDVDGGEGMHTVTYRYAFGSTTGRTAFTVERDGSRFGLFPAWRFVDSPVSTVAVTPLHDSAFTANGVDVVSKGGPDAEEDYLVLTPSRVTLSHTSEYLTAEPHSVLIDQVDAAVPAQVDVQANTAFVSAVQKELNAFLAKCVKQKVLLPTDCPMGKQFSDRIQDAPTWSMVTYPVVTIVPGSDGGWLVPRTEAIAHLTVTVKSIFDGSVSVFDQDVRFSVSYTIAFGANGPVITATQ